MIHRRYSNWWFLNFHQPHSLHWQFSFESNVLINHIDGLTYNNFGGPFEFSLTSYVCITLQTFKILCITVKVYISFYNLICSYKLYNIFSFLLLPFSQKNPNVIHISWNRVKQSLTILSLVTKETPGQHWYSIHNVCVMSYFVMDQNYIFDLNFILFYLQS